MSILSNQDPEIASVINQELERQRHSLAMIPSENYTSLAVMEAAGTILTNKYAEGYPGKRYYCGNSVVDILETLAIERAKKLFHADCANVQPNAGSGANMAALFAILQPGDTIMGMSLPMGGHLTHGYPLNFTGKIYKAVQYGVDKNGFLNMEEIREMAKRERPKVIISGATAYPRLIDFKAFADIAHEVGAIAMADISHIAGLIVGEVHPHPFPWSDIVTTTTHKTLRGPRSAIILSKAEFGPKIDKAIIPGLQGGPLEHIIAAKAVNFKEAMEPSFKDYAKQTVVNAKILAETLMANGLKLISGGTDTHLILADVTSLGTLGHQAAIVLEEVDIVVNKNMIPYDPRKPLDPSGIRLGTPALTTRGFKEDDMRVIGRIIVDVLKNPTSDDVKNKARATVRELTDKYPLYPEL